ncbi:MAG: SDR family NAD(P)-dependent oxidoreductase [Spirochaetota bacterium]
MGLGILSEKVTIITGGTSGLGAEMAKEFTKAGSSVVICGRNEEKGKAVVQEVEENGGNISFIKCDITNEGAVKKLINSTIKLFGKLDIAVNNAGVTGEMIPLVEHTQDSWDKIITTNLTSVWLCMKYEIPEMIKSNSGVILNISSAGGLVGMENLVPYTASKHGIVGMSKSASHEVGKYGIRVNALCPGGIKTPLDEVFYKDVENREEKQKQRLKNYALGRHAEAFEIAQTAVWLCSDHSSFITGAAISADGGKVAK